MAKKLTSSKAKEILHDKSVHGQPLTDKQRRFFGAIAGGAKPYKAESGGWLDKYDAPKAQNGIEGTMGGLTDKGFNYNGAWGGTMQMGGSLTFLEPTSRKLPMGHAFPYKDPSTELAVSVGGEGGEPAYLIPSFKYGKLLNDPKAEFRKTGEHLGGPFKTWQEADEWERTVRHPYVEKGQSIPTPFRRWGKDFAMGGSLPGAVGFTYARTAGAAPANGPYAKKTKASAQSGKKIKEDSNLENIVEIVDPTGITSWDDVYRSYKKTGMSPETGLEIFGALPMIGKVGKIGKFAEAASKAFAATGRQKRNAKAVAETLKGVGKYGPTAGRSTDAYQTYDQWENGGSMKYYQEGLDWKPRNISRDGSEIPVDPMGYWNPENVGNPVIIPSTDITMEGVDQPLIGISDTGDVQYMQPGEDYSFDGEYVTEYPVAQQGIRQPLYVSDPNDPRLKTYQDSLYSYNVGQRMAGILQNDKNLMKVIPKSPIYKNLQAALKAHGNKLLDNSLTETGGYKNYEKIAEIMKEYQSKANKGILPIKIQPYYPNPDNMVKDLITLRDFWDATGITEKLGGQPRPAQANLPEWKKPEQPVEYRKREQSYLEKLGLTTEDLKKVFSSDGKDWTATPGQDGDGYYRYKKDNKTYKIYTSSGGFSRAEIEKPAVKKQEPKKKELQQPKQEVVKKAEPVVEKKQNVYEGTPVYSPGAGSGLGSALIGFRGPKGDTTYIKPEDYERFAVPKYGKEYIEKKKMKNGGVSVNMADQYPIEKLDQSLNFTNYNKPTKGGWLDKYK